MGDGWLLLLEDALVQFFNARFRLRYFPRSLDRTH